MRSEGWGDETPGRRLVEVKYGVWQWVAMGNIQQLQDEAVFLCPEIVTIY